MSKNKISGHHLYTHRHRTKSERERGLHVDADSDGRVSLSMKTFCLSGPIATDKRNPPSLASRRCQAPQRRIPLQQSPTTGHIGLKNAVAVSVPCTALSFCPRSGPDLMGTSDGRRSPQRGFASHVILRSELDVLGAEK